MRKAVGYSLEEIGNEYYLIPFGQMKSNRRNIIHLNNTAATAWKFFSDDEIDVSALLQHIFETYSIKEEDKNSVREDIYKLLDNFIYSGVLIGDTQVNTANHYLEIAGISMVCTEAILNESLLEFSIPKPTDEVDLTINVNTASSLTAPDELGKMLIYDENVIISKRDDDFLLTFPMLKSIQQVVIKNDYSKASFFVYDMKNDQTKEDFFNALRFVFLGKACLYGKVAIHSSSIYSSDNKVILFSAASGVGKSTQANLWEELNNAKIINGDVNLLEIIDDKLYCLGTPWCGTSNIFSKASYPVDAIVFLEQADENHAFRLRPTDGVICTLKRVISPDWMYTMYGVTLDFSNDISESIPMIEYSCTKDADSYDYLNNYLEKNIWHAEN